MGEKRCKLGTERRFLVFFLVVGASFIFTLLSSVDRAFAQTPKKTRPKIGLALGGGGAKAGAQIGVLKILRELRIPVDAITGTSMGSFIGALYATGYEIEEIEEILIQTDWDDVFSNAVDRNRKPIRRKQDDINFLARGKLGVTGKGFVLPKGIVDSAKLRLLLRRLTMHVAHLQDFDQFPIPYRCVAMDLLNGAEVILGSGDLPPSVVSSMSLPAIFPPVVIDGRYLVDGGSVNNLPVTVAEKMGADIVIAVDVGAPFYKPEDITSFFAVFDQLNTITARGNVEEMMKEIQPQHIVVHPNFQGLTTYDYNRIQETFAMGIEATQKVLDRLRKLSLSEEEYAAHLAARKTYPRGQPIIVGKLSFDNSTIIDDKIIGETLDIEVGKELSLDHLEDKIADLRASENYQTLDYHLVKEGEKEELVFKATPNKRTKNFLQFGLRLDTDFRNDATFDIGSRFVMTRLNRLMAEWRTDLQLGYNTHLDTEFYQPLGYRQDFFVLPSAYVGRRKVDVFLNRAIVAKTSIAEAGVDLAFGQHILNLIETRVGVVREWAKISPDIATVPVSAQWIDTGAYFVGMILDSIDNTRFPRNGVLTTIGWKQALDALGSDYTFRKISGSAYGAMSFGRSTLLLSGEGGSILDENAGPQELFALGGFLRLTGYRQDALTGQHYGLGRLMYYFQLIPGAPASLDTTLYVGASVETGNVWNAGNEFTPDSLLWAGSGFLGLDTVLGPIMVGGGYAQGGGGGAYLLIGRYFRLVQ